MVEYYSKSKQRADMEVLKSNMLPVKGECFLVFLCTFAIIFKKQLLLKDSNFRKLHFLLLKIMSLAFHTNMTMASTLLPTTATFIYYLQIQPHTMVYLKL